MQIYANVRYVSKSLLVLIFSHFSPFVFTEGDLGKVVKKNAKPPHFRRIFCDTKLK